MTQEILIAKIATLCNKLESQQKEIDELRQRIIKLENRKKISIMGWSINQKKDGYWYGQKRIKEKVYTIYIGKIEDAKSKIIEWNQKNKVG